MMAAFSTFVVLPLQYVLGFVVVAIIIAAVVGMVSRPKRAWFEVFADEHGFSATVKSSTRSFQERCEGSRIFSH